MVPLASRVLVVPTAAMPCLGAVAYYTMARRAVSAGMFRSQLASSPKSRLAGRRRCCLPTRALARHSFGALTVAPAGDAGGGEVAHASGPSASPMPIGRTGAR